MANLSVRTIAEKCLGKSGQLSLKEDIFSTPPYSLRRRLKHIYRHRCPPRPPSNLRITDVTESTISVAWKDNADNEDGFELIWRGERVAYTDDNGEQKVSGPNRESYTLTGLHPGFKYCIKVKAYNSGAKSRASNEDCATIPLPSEVTRFVDLQRQTPYEGFIYYTGEWPSGGLDKGRLKKIHVPQSGPVDHQVHFVKGGFSSNDCNNPAAVVVLWEGETSTPEQLKEIYGVSEPSFGPLKSIPFLACLGSAVGWDPEWLRIDLIVILD